MTSLAALKVSVADKLPLLRRLDQFRTWDSLDDERQCIQCGQIITGRKIEVVGGTRELGPLRLQCPTKDCPALPIDWIRPARSAQSLFTAGVMPALDDAISAAPVPDRGPVQKCSEHFSPT